MKKKIFLKGFTLIELLVVIAILALLSSIVLVFLQGVKDKARVAKTLQFSESIYHSLGADAVGVWNFDEGSGLTAKDSSDNGNNGAISGAVYTNETPHKVVGAGQGKYALSFNGAGYFVNVADSDSLDITSAITIEAWIKAYTTGRTWQGIVTKWANSGVSASYAIYITNEKIEFVVSGGALDVADTSVITDGIWHHIVATFDSSAGTNNGKLFVDGNLKQQGAYSGTITVGTSPVKIGVDQTGANYFNGFIDQVRIYNRALTSAQIQKHYVQGLENTKILQLNK